MSVSGKAKAKMKVHFIKNGNFLFAKSFPKRKSAAKPTIDEVESTNPINVALLSKCCCIKSGTTYDKIASPIVMINTTTEKASKNEYAPKKLTFTLERKPGFASVIKRSSV